MQRLRRQQAELRVVRLGRHEFRFSLPGLRQPELDLHCSFCQWPSSLAPETGSRRPCYRRVSHLTAPVSHVPTPTELQPPQPQGSWHCTQPTPPTHSGMMAGMALKLALKSDCHPKGIVTEALLRIKEATAPIATRRAMSRTAQTAPRRAMSKTI